MEIKYIIDPTNFKGSVEVTMSSNEGEPRLVDYMEKETTLEEYKAIKGKENLIAMGWEELESKFISPYLKSIQYPFLPCLEKNFIDALECLPPKKWTRKEGAEFFFIGEPTTFNLHQCYVRKGNEFFTALRDLFTNPESIFNLEDVTT